ncbi:hypothetical protein ABK040_014639 [Willaertia magna]
MLSQNSFSVSTTFNIDEVKKQIEEWKNKLNEFNCPIAQQLMTDPVIIESGHTFDRSSIEEWLKHNNTCPITRIELKYKTLTPVYAFKTTIKESTEKFIKKVIKNVKLWCSDDILTEICLHILDESLDLIKNNSNFNNYQNELKELKFNILLNELNEDKLFNNFKK